MAFCPNCGKAVTEGANFCPSCGVSLTGAVAAATTVAATAASDRNIDLMLVSLGTCPSSEAAALLEDTCGYSAEDALTLVSNLPTTVARNMTDEVASTLAQALTEYGMEVTLYDDAGYRSVAPRYTNVFDSTGAYVAEAAAVLALLNSRNRLTRAMMRRMDYPHRFDGPRPPLFFTGAPVRRPPHVRRPFGAPAPRGPMGGRPAAPAPRGPVGGGSRGGMGGPGGGSRGGAGGPRGGMGGPGGGSRGGMGGPGGGSRGGMGGPGGGHGGPGGGRGR